MSDLPLGAKLAEREVSEMTEKTAVEKTTAKLKRRVGKAYNDAIMELLAEGGYAPATQALLIACGEIARVATETVTALREQAKEAEDRG